MLGTDRGTSGRHHRDWQAQTGCYCLFVAAAWLASLGWAPAASAYIVDQRWTSTALGSTGVNGDPIRLYWSIVPEGTSIPGIPNAGVSNLISFFDTHWGAGPGGTNLTLRPWFPLVEQSFQRWSDLGGVTFIYEPRDDGATHGTAPGSIGVRGDIRIGGMNIDGPSGTLAYSHHPNNSDLVIDTSDSPFFLLTSESAPNYRRLRNTLMHELGHGLGLAHIVSNNAAFLLEPSINPNFDGPQLDDIRGLHFLYGDVFEKTHNGLGNGTPARATSLGAIASGSSRVIGADAGPDTVVAATDIDFVSISNSNDADYFSFTVAEAARLNAVLAPRGGIYKHGMEGGTQTDLNANAGNDLALTLFGSNGTSLLAFANGAPAGGVEMLTNVSLPAAGQYFVRVTGATNAVQLYELHLSVLAAATVIAGDFNGDGVVDAADYTVWRDMLNQVGPGLAADGNGDQIVNQLDYQLWKTNFGAILASGAGQIGAAVPEPGTLGLLAAPGAIFLFGGRQRRTRRPVAIRRA